MIEERFGQGQDISIGVQAIPLLATTTLTLGNIVGTDPQQGVELVVDLIPPVTDIESPLDTTTRVWTYSFAMTSGNVDPSMTWSIKRINGAVSTTVASGGPTVYNAPIVVSSGTSTVTYTNSDAETLRLSLTGSWSVWESTVWTITTSAYYTEWTPTVSVVGVQALHNNVESKRPVIVDFYLAGELYELKLVFHDETLESQDVLGNPKRKSNG